MQPTQWRALPTIGLNRCPAMMHIIANQFTLTEFLLDSLDPAQRADVLMHPKRIKLLGYSILKAMAAWSPFPLPGFRPFPQTYLQALAGLGVLRESKQGREKYYINDALFAELSA